MTMIEVFLADWPIRIWMLVGPQDQLTPTMGVYWNSKLVYTSN